MPKKRMRAGLETTARKRVKRGPIIARRLSRITVVARDEPPKARAGRHDYRGCLPDVLGVINDNTRLRGEVVRLSAENARLKMALGR